MGSMDGYVFTTHLTFIHGCILGQSGSLEMVWLTHVVFVDFMSQSCK